MFLDKRSLEIIKILLKYPHLKSKDLEEKLSLSRRQITYSIEKANGWLEANGLPVIQRNNAGTFLLTQKVQNYFAEQMQWTCWESETDYIPTEQERSLMIVLYLIDTSEEVSLAHLMDLLKVSKNTALSDVKLAMKYIEPFKLAITYSRMRGYCISGEEIAARRLIRKLVMDLLEMYHGSDFMDELLGERREGTFALVREMEQLLNIKYTDQSLDVLSYVIAFNLSRAQNNHQLSKKSMTLHTDIKDTREYRTVQQILEAHMSLSDLERNWLILQFLMANIQQSAIHDFEETRLKEAVELVISLFEDKVFIKVSDRRILMERLFMHLRPAYYRSRYHLNLEVDSYEAFIRGDDNLLILFNIIQEIIYPIEESLHVRFPQNELALLTFLFGTELVNQGISLKNKTIAVVVCPNGLTISRLLKHTLKDLFPDFVFTETLSSREFSNYPSRYDIAFTSVPVTTDKLSFLVEPLMSDSEKIGLKRQVYQKLGLYDDEAVQRIMEVVKQYTQVTDEESLEQALHQVVLANKSETKAVTDQNTLPDLNSYFPQDAIQMIDSAEDWKEALALACSPLLKRGIITENYIDALIAENDTEESYSFLGDCMAIPHSSVEKGVLSDGFALLILKKPVQFRNRKQIRIITPLAILNQSVHLKAIIQLNQLAEDEVAINSMLAAVEPTVIREIIKEASKKKV
ncbi:phosphotransferase/anion transporter [Trichococcus palustris]|uniref:Ascorbate-specific PTS system EIIA component n=1 Tax=Trichococcus palustris TaxID=140314 RepID=A0A143YRL8_9LACT|nr:BglG family transcription antiterminator [Trichococcus palustris]CZQ96823.1 phosphotransferase/anion transporter [Trichococcus palustris]SFK74589.1 Transcriptional antiterminator [Trichococcus palustris]